MENKIQELTEKLLREGVDKGNAEAERIVADANERAAQIVADAKKQAEDIVVTAKKDAANLDSNTKSELRMYTQQAVNALKSEIANVVSSEVIKTTVAGITSDKTFMNMFMLKMAEKWGAQEELIISASDAESLKSFFVKEAKSLLDKGLRIEQVNGQKVQFMIQPVDGSYKVNLGNEEFENYFKSFLRPQLVDMLF